MMNDGIMMDDLRRLGCIVYIMSEARCAVSSSIDSHSGVRQRKGMG